MRERAQPFQNSKKRPPEVGGFAANFACGFFRALEGWNSLAHSFVRVVWSERKKLSMALKLSQVSTPMQDKLHFAKKIQTLVQYKPAAAARLASWPARLAR